MAKPIRDFSYEGQKAARANNAITESNAVVNTMASSLENTLIVGERIFNQYIKAEGKEGVDAAKDIYEKYPNIEDINRSQIESTPLAQSQAQVASNSSYAISDNVNLEVDALRSRAGSYFLKIIKEVEFFETKLLKNRAVFLGLDPKNSTPEEIKNGIIKFYQTPNLTYGNFNMTAPKIMSAIIEEYIKLEKNIQGSSLSNQYTELKSFQDKLHNNLKGIDGLLQSSLQDSTEFLSMYELLNGNLLNIFEKMGRALFTSETISAKEGKTGVNADIHQVKSAGVTAAELLEKTSLVDKMNQRMQNAVSSSVISFEIKNVGSVPSSDYLKYLTNTKQRSPNLLNMYGFLEDIIFKNEKTKNDTLKNILQVFVSPSGKLAEGTETSKGKKSETTKSDIEVNAIITYTDEGGSSKKVRYHEKIDAKLGQERYRRAIFNNTIKHFQTSAMKRDNTVNMIMKLIATHIIINSTMEKETIPLDIKTLDSFPEIKSILQSYVLAVQFLSDDTKKTLGIEKMDNTMSTLINVGGNYMLISEFLKLIYNGYFIEQSGEKAVIDPKTFNEKIIQDSLTLMNNKLGNKAKDKDEAIKLLTDSLFPQLINTKTKTTLDLKQMGKLLTGLRGS